MVGPSCVLAALVDGLEQAKQAAWNNGSWQQRFPVLHGLMLRVPTAERDAVHARLLDPQAKIHKWYGGAKLDILLHGREGIRRSGYKYSVEYKSYGTHRKGGEDDPSNTTDRCYLDEDRDFVAQQYEALWTAFRWKAQRGMMDVPPARLLFLGGNAALETELRAIGGYPGTMQVEAFEHYADLRGPLVDKLMTALAKPGSKAEKKARAWLDGA